MSHAPAQPIRLVIVDDSELVRTGLRTLLDEVSDFLIVGEADGAKAALALCAATRPQLVLLDFRLPDGDGLEVCARLLRQQPELRVLFLTSADDARIVEEAMRAGAHGYLLKEINFTALVQAIRDIIGGRSVLDPQVTAPLLERLRDGFASGPTVQLSTQERRVLKLVASGKTNKEAAAELGLGEKTVKNYLGNVFTKLKVTRRAEAAAWYARQNPADPSPPRHD